jgi:Mrp family chromosome partitioning ATPase
MSPQLYDTHLVGSSAVSQDSAVLGTIPWIPQKLYASYYPPRTLQIVQTSCGLAYQCLASNLMKMRHKGNTVLVSGTSSEKTPSWIMMNLVYFLARNEQKILLVDADFQWPTVHHAFDIPINQSMGFGDLLEVLSQQDMRQSSPSVIGLLEENILPAEEIPNLYLLHNATGAQNEFEDWNKGDAFSVFTATLRRSFDWILLDTSPLLNSVVPIALGQSVDGLVMLQDKIMTSRLWQQVHQVIDQHRLPLWGEVQRGGVHSPYQALSPL